MDEADDGFLHWLGMHHSILAGLGGTLISHAIPLFLIGHYRQWYKVELPPSSVLITTTVSAYFFGVLGFATMNWTDERQRAELKVSGGAYAHFLLYGPFIILPWPAVFAFAYLNPMNHDLIMLLGLSSLLLSRNWILWQVRRSNNPALGFLPRYSLKTLLLCSLACGVILLIFTARK